MVVQVRLLEGRSTQRGLNVDGVEEVLSVAAADIEETPAFGSQITTDYILGMAKVRGAVKTLLDVDCVVAAEASDLIGHPPSEQTPNES
jgi:purine-binding chemotaxis protein CheW